jgi:N-acetylglucosamine-6-phosphate deacetylase
VRLAFAASPGRCSLVSDAIAAAGLGDGSYRLGELEIEVEGGVARRSDGVLAGSAAPLREGLERLFALGIASGDAVAAVTERPARVLGDPTLGQLEPGGPADLAVVDEQLALREVFAGGEMLA